MWVCWIFTGRKRKKRKFCRIWLRTIVHRGPDSEGKYLDEDIALGFRRLSIVDLSEHGNQPMFNENRSLDTGIQW